MVAGGIGTRGFELGGIYPRACTVALQVGECLLGEKFIDGCRGGEARVGSTRLAARSRLGCVILVCRCAGCP